MFSMWLGFFAWYRGLALGGTVHASQVQVVQPFLGMLFAVPLLGETLDTVTPGFGLAVMVGVLVGKRMPVCPSDRSAPVNPFSLRSPRNCTPSLSFLTDNTGDKNEPQRPAAQHPMDPGAPR